jgi:hypothetical protein
MLLLLSKLLAVKTYNINTNIFWVILRFRIKNTTLKSGLFYQKTAAPVYQLTNLPEAIARSTIFWQTKLRKERGIVSRYSYWYKKPKYYWASRQNWLKKKTPSYRNYTKYGNSIKLIAKRYFPKAILEDIFHVQKSVLAALQEIRNKHSQKATDGENQSILLTK